MDNDQNDPNQVEQLVETLPIEQEAIEDLTIHENTVEVENILFNINEVMTEPQLTDEERRRFSASQDVNGEVVTEEIKPSVPQSKRESKVTSPRRMSFSLSKSTIRSPQEMELIQQFVQNKEEAQNETLDQEVQVDMTKIEDEMSQLQSEMSLQIVQNDIERPDNIDFVDTKDKSRSNSKKSSSASTKVASNHVSKQPTPVISKQPTPIPSKQPTPVISKQPTPVISKQPTPVISKQPTPVISKQPTPAISKQPTPVISQEATPIPSKQPTPIPSKQPTPIPSKQATPAISKEATPIPSKQATPIGSRRNSIAEKELEIITEEQNEAMEEQGDLTDIKVDENGEITSTRSRKDDRRLLASDLGSELPITLRYNDNVHVDNKEPVDNYTAEWSLWTQDGMDKIEDLLLMLDELERKYISSSKFNTRIGKAIQFSLLILGSGIVYVQASGANTDLIQKWNIAGGAATTIATTLYNFFGFAKKGPHFGTVAQNLKKLKCWIESKLVLPVEKRFSPFDIYIIATKALQVIMEEAQQGKQETK